jgi:hypothetical protein
MESYDYDRSVAAGTLKPWGDGLVEWMGSLAKQVIDVVAKSRKFHGLKLNSRPYEGRGWEDNIMGVDPNTGKPVNIKLYVYFSPEDAQVRTRVTFIKNREMDVVVDRAIGFRESSNPVIQEVAKYFAAA